MNYTILIYEAPADFALRQNPAKQPAYVAGWARYTRALMDAGIWVAGAGLHGSDSATLLKLRDGKRMVQDGPYAETKEQLGGFYLIEAKDLNDAIQVAARIPSVRWGSVEVRPVWEAQRP